MKTDQELLKGYFERGEEGAFEELVERYVRLVHGVCRRQLRDRHLAEDATQGVFVLLSRSGGKVRQERVAGWLLTAARFTCAAIRKREMRRVKREEAAAMREEIISEQEREEMLAMLDEGLWRLKAEEREAVARRYLQEQSLKEVGEGLAISEEAARKRVDRGVEKLRRYFARRGVAASAAGVMALIATENARAAAIPAKEMAMGIVRACRSGDGGSAMTLATGTKTMMRMAKMKSMAAMGLVAMGIVGVGGWVTVTVLADGVASPPARGEQVQAATTAATFPVVVDLSSPKRELDSLVAALRAGDREKVYACLAVDPKRAPTELDGCLAWNLAENRLMAAAREKFGKDAETMLKGMSGRNFEGIFKTFSGMGVETVEGDAATVEIPAAAMAKVSAQGEDTQWAGKPLRFKRENGEWKLDMDHSMAVRMTLVGTKEVDTEADAARNAKVLMGLGTMIDGVTEQVTAELLSSPTEVRNTVRRGFGKVFQENGARDITGMSVMPMEGEVGKH